MARPTLGDLIEVLLPVGAARSLCTIGFTREFWNVLREAWREPFYVSSNFAREFSVEVALAASLGFISTVSPSGNSYGRTWHITAAGIAAWRLRETE